MEITQIKKKDKLGKDALFKISRFKEIIKKTSPHKHEGYFELIFLYEGAGFHWIDTEKLQVEPIIPKELRNRRLLTGKLCCAACLW